MLPTRSDFNSKTGEARNAAQHAGSYLATQNAWSRCTQSHIVDHSGGVCLTSTVVYMRAIAQGHGVYDPRLKLIRCWDLGTLALLRYNPEKVAFVLGKRPLLIPAP